MSHLGATPEEWAHFDFVLGLGANLLPCVPASQDVKVMPGSALAGKVGKIPSTFNARGEAHGLLNWTKREITSTDVAEWTADCRLNVCVRTGAVSGIYAFDIDIDDSRADDVRALIEQTVGATAIRLRDNSSKQLLMVRMEGACKKRKLKLDDNPRGAAVEWLADGQQFVACGSHASGVRYRWDPEPPSSIPTITLAQLEAIWATLTSKYAKTLSVTTAPTAVAKASAATASEVMTTISEHDWQHLLSCLRFLLDKVQSNDDWSSVGYALLSLQGTERPAERLWLDFSSKAVGYEGGAAEAWWASHRAQTPRSDYRHIFNMARQRGMQRIADPAAFTPVVDESHMDLVDVVPAEVGGLPAVRISGANFSYIIKQLEDIINSHVYTQGSHLVRTTEAHNDGAIQRNNEALMLVSATREWARTQFGQLCNFQKYVKKSDEWVTVAPSLEHISTVLGLGSWRTLRPLDAIARAPFLRQDGSICDVAGYDPISRALYVPSAAYPPIPERPLQADALAALARLREPFDEFPWKEAASESAFVSHVLAEAARLAMERCPMYFYDAPMAGTGKSTLQEMAARIVHGTEPALRPWVADEDEIRKALYACLMAGDRSIWFDNVPDGIKVRSSVLEAFITSAVWKDRKLGESSTSAIPNKTVLVASGNNMTPVGALARRSLVIRLDANTEHLRERVFKIENPRRHIMARRAQLLVDALTIIRAYLATGGVPGMPVTLPSFEEWSRLAREPLIWLGMADPVITQLNETDDESHNIGPAFAKLGANFGERAFTAAEMVRIVGSLTDEHNELSDALMQMGCSDPNNPLKVGYWLRASKDKIGGGWKLVHDGHTNQGAKWRLRRLNGDLTNV